MNSKLHVLADAKGRPIGMFLSAGQTSDYIGARALLSSIPQAGALLADRGYDADWFRNAPCQGSCPLLHFSSISQVGGIGR